MILLWRWIFRNSKLFWTLHHVMKMFICGWNLLDEVQHAWSRAQISCWFDRNCLQSRNSNTWKAAFSPPNSSKHQQSPCSTFPEKNEDKLSKVKSQADLGIHPAVPGWSWVRADSSPGCHWEEHMLGRWILLLKQTNRLGLEHLATMWKTVTSSSLLQTRLNCNTPSSHMHANTKRTLRRGNKVSVWPAFHQAASHLIIIFCYR